MQPKKRCMQIPRFKLVHNVLICIAVSSKTCILQKKKKKSVFQNQQNFYFFFYFYLFCFILIWFLPELYIEECWSFGIVRNLHSCCKGLKLYLYIVVDVKILTDFQNVFEFSQIFSLIFILNLYVPNDYV